MNRIAEGFWVATALVTSTALLVVFMPIIAIVTLLALALPTVIGRIQRRRTSNDEASRFGGNEPVGQPKFRVIETTYTVID
jgi:hypothetical protein